MSTVAIPKPETTFEEFAASRGTIPTGALAPEVVEPPGVVEAPAGGGSQLPPKTAEPSGGSGPKPGEADDKGKGGIQRRIDELTRERYQRDGRIAELERQLTEARKAPAAAPAGSTAAPAATVGEDTEPLVEAFETYEKYIDARSAWIYRREATKTAQTAEANRVAGELHTKATQLKERMDAAALKHDDFQEVLQQTTPINPASEVFMLESEQGAEIAYYLGKNPEEAARISKLGPVATMRELVKIESSLAPPPAKPEPKPAVSRAPKPPVQVTATSGEAPRNPKDAASFEEYEELRRAKR